jgi:two-component system phosphate regulon response regulator PhoB
MIQLHMTPRKVLFVARPTESLVPWVARLRDADCLVEIAVTGAEGLRRTAELAPEIVVIEDALPDITPMELMLQLRSILPASSSPVFMLAGPRRPAEEDPAPGPKQQRPPDPSVPHLIDQILRFVAAQPEPPPSGDRISHGSLMLDRSRHRVWLDGELVHLTPTEFRLLWELARRPGFVLSRKDLTPICRGTEHLVQARTIDAHIKSIRRKLNHRSDLIETVHGVGYRLQEETNVPSRIGVHGNGRRMSESHA